jgi:hypothetical protein
MTHSRNDVTASVKARFRESRWDAVLEALDGYGVEPHERERERVQLAILNLCAGEEDKMREYVAVAKRDYRDVLLWAEYPQEARLDTPEKIEEARDLLKRLGVEPPSDLPE